MTRRMTGMPALLAATALLVAGCAAEEQEQPTPLRPAPSASSPQDPLVDPLAGPVEPVGEPASLLTGLDLPWSIAVLATGSTLISERDTARVMERTPGGDLREAGRVPGVVPGGEGGLLGLATLAEGSASWLYAYVTAADDNRVVRMPLTGAPGSYALGDPEVVIEGIAKAGNHNGGRIAFGPDGMLYATTGDASDTDRSQDPDSLNGKILRATPEGSAPPDNPFPGSLVYSLGHRNPQGLAWDADGQLWAAEFGQNTWDEFNRIEAGANYGWPIVEGVGDDPAFVDPEYQWPTSDASPSGLAYVRDTFFLAALRGQRVWALYTDDAVEAVPYFQGVYGRIRDVAAGPDGTLWMLTSNTGGEPRDGDDQLIQVQLAPVAGG